MNKKVIGGVLAVALVAIVGVGVYYSSHSQSDDSKVAKTIDPTKVFEPKAPADMDFEVTVTSGSETQPMSLKIKHAKNGDTESTTGMSGVTLTTYIIDKEYIQCTADQCLSSGKIPERQQIPSANYAFTKEYILAMQRGSKYTGSEQCGKSTCAKWEINSEVMKGIFYIDKENRIVKIVNTPSEDSSTPTGTEAKTTTASPITYTYGNITITRPANVQKLQPATPSPTS
ncbi:hypothetical protein KC949_02375 [Candidatus Saccharibacteria bacterium]|jgi:hypothetical protein|nr:hypothetical protein [Candidatus Saccharibacteria bacterium]